MNKTGILGIPVIFLFLLIYIELTGCVSDPVSPARKSSPDKNVREVERASCGPGDFFGDGVVDMRDFILFFSAYNDPLKYDTKMDLDKDGKVGLFDFALLVNLHNTIYKDRVIGEDILGKNIHTLLDLNTTMDFTNDIINLTFILKNMVSVCGYSFELSYDFNEYEFISINEINAFNRDSIKAVSFASDINGKVEICEYIPYPSRKNSLIGDAAIVELIFKWIGDDAPMMKVENLYVIDEKLGINYLDKGFTPHNPNQGIELMPNYPDPFKDKTTIRFGLPHSAFITLEVYDSYSRLVRTLVDNVKYRAGIRSVEWDGKDDMGKKANPGIYICKLIVDRYEETEKMILIK